MTAVATGSTEIAQALLAKGADVNVKGNGGVTALQLAEKRGDEVLIKLLKDAKKKQKQ